MASRVAVAFATIASLAYSANALALTSYGRRHKPRTAVLLVGQMRNWNSPKINFVDLFLDNVVNPNNADVFVHTADYDRNPPAFQEILGPYIRSQKLEEHSTPPHGVADYQFEDFEKGFKLMEEYEDAHGLMYDVVVKARTEIVPAQGSLLDLAGWEAPGRIHMMTDMILWGQRDDMKVMSKFFSAIHPFFQVQYANTFTRPIDVRAMLESLSRDKARYNVSFDDEDYVLRNKFEVLPYPDMGKRGAIANLQEAVSRNITTCKGDAECPQHCGDKYTREGDPDPHWCEQAWGGDYYHGDIRCEKDILAWAFAQGLMVCDLGKSVKEVMFKGQVIPRKGARDCDEADDA